MVMKNTFGSGSLQTTIDILGNRWTALIIDELTSGPSCFCDVEKKLPGISPRTLSQRLDRLQAEGIITRQLYNQRPPRYNYALTSKGRDLTPVVKAMSAWGAKYAQKF